MLKEVYQGEMCQEKCMKEKCVKRNVLRRNISRVLYQRAYKSDFSRNGISMVYIWKEISEYNLRFQFVWSQNLKKFKLNSWIKYKQGCD